MVAEEWGEVVDRMLQMNLHPVLAAGDVASNHMAGQDVLSPLLLVLFWSATCKSNVISITPDFQIGKVTRAVMVEFEPVVTDCSFCFAFDSLE
eukprot:4159441-Ditylum_brightwellii.AAC.1